MKTRDKLLFQAHIRALKRLRLKAGNLGWVASDNVYLSKTNGGILQSVRIAERRYKHEILK